MAMPAPNALQPGPPRTLVIEPARSCTEIGLGLTHLRLNLECALHLAALSGRTLELHALREGGRHTGCAAPGKYLESPWADVVDLSGQPYCDADTGGCPSQAAPSNHTRHLPFDVSARGLRAMREAGEPRLQLLLGPMSPYCNYYQACSTMIDAPPPPGLPPSKSVRAGADGIIRALGGAGAYDGAHVRQGDKVHDQMYAKDVHALSGRDLAQRLSVLLPPLHIPTAGAPPPTIYLATDALELADSPCVHACFRASTWHAHAEALMVKAPQAELLRRCSPYWVVRDAPGPQPPWQSRRRPAAPPPPSHPSHLRARHVSRRRQWRGKC